jgi:hypothetical protein
MYSTRPVIMCSRNESTQKMAQLVNMHTGAKFFTGPTSVFFVRCDSHNSSLRHWVCNQRGKGEKGPNLLSRLRPITTRQKSTEVRPGIISQDLAERFDPQFRVGSWEVFVSVISASLSLDKKFP